MPFDKAQGQAWPGLLTGPGSLLASDLLSPGGKLRALAGALGLRQGRKMAGAGCRPQAARLSERCCC